MTTFCDAITIDELAKTQTDDSPETTKEKEALRNRFFSACRALGRALAVTERNLIIGTESPNTADRCVVDGAASAEGSPG